MTVTEITTVAPPVLTLAGLAHLELARLHAQFVAGESAALPLAIKVAGLMGWPLPKWAADAWADCCSAVFSARAASWDDVLKDPGDIIRGNRQHARVRKKIERFAALIDLVAAIPPPTAIDETYFQQLGAQLGMRAPAVRKLFYQINTRTRPRAKRSRPKPRSRNGVS